MPASLSIIVYKGSPVDASEYRHTALLIEFSDSTSLLIHITGASGFFQGEVKENQDPSKSQKFVRKIPVAKIEGQSKDAIRTRIRATPIKNSDRSWNCQNWIGDALKTLSDQQWISKTARQTAINTMAEAVVDAPDES